MLISSTHQRPWLQMAENTTYIQQKCIFQQQQLSFSLISIFFRSLCHHHNEARGADARADAGRIRVQPELVQHGLADPEGGEHPAHSLLQRDQLLIAALTHRLHQILRGALARNALIAWLWEQKIDWLMRRVGGEKKHNIFTTNFNFLSKVEKHF